MFFLVIPGHWADFCLWLRCDLLYRQFKPLMGKLHSNSLIEESIERVLVLHFLMLACTHKVKWVFFRRPFVLNRVTCHIHSNEFMRWIATIHSSKKHFYLIYMIISCTSLHFFVLLLFVGFCSVSRAESPGPEHNHCDCWPFCFIRQWWFVPSICICTCSRTNKLWHLLIWSCKHWSWCCTSDVWCWFGWDRFYWSPESYQVRQISFFVNYLIISLSQRSSDLTTTHPNWNKCSWFFSASSIHIAIDDGPQSLESDAVASFPPASTPDLQVIEPSNTVKVSILYKMEVWFYWIYT